MEATMSKAEALKAATAADEAFHAILVKFYGKRNAGDARYRYTHESPEVQAAADAFKAAMAAYHEAK